jgi:hypothetical protein
MSNFRLFFNRVIINWHYILIFSISLLSIHFFFLNDYHLQVKDSQAGVVPATDAHLTSESPVILDPSAGKDGVNTVGLEHGSSNEVTVVSNGEGNATASDKPEDKSYLSVPYKPEDEYLAICISMKDQTKDLPEWLIHHYHHIGIRRFYIMDDGSDPPISQQLTDFGIPKSALTFHYQPRETRDEHMQVVFYQQCQEWFGDKHTWIAYIDGDEFLEATGNETVQDVLRSFDADESVGALGVHWKMHNSNGLLTRPKSARKGFTTCLWDSPEDYLGGTDDNHHIKSIVKTSKFLHYANPHKFDLRDGANTVTEHGDVVTTVAWRSPITRDRVALHHYAVKSRQEYEEKMARSNGMGQPKGEEFWNHMETTPNNTCNEMAMYDP